MFNKKDKITSIVTVEYRLWSRLKGHTLPSNSIIGHRVISIKMNDVSKKYLFNRLFDVKANQTQIFEDFSQYVDGIANCGSLMVIGIGASGSGKSYSLGTSSNERPKCHGLFIRSISKLLSKANAGDKIQVSATELNSTGVIDLNNDDGRAVVNIECMEGR